VIPVERAIEIVLRSTPRLPSESVDFEQALGRVLAEDVASDLDLPPFPRSSVDGFALRAADLSRVPARLRIAGVVPAGVPPAFRLEAGEAAQVMTGAPVPEGADAVQMVEKTRELGPQEVEVLEAVPSGQNIAPRGDELRAGEIVLTAGTRIDPAGLAVLATVGKTRVLVSRRPRVAVAATGNELVHPSERPGPAKIRNSNGFSVSAQARQAGAEVRYLGVARDDEASLGEAVRAGLAEDVLILTGGVSMGKYDLVEDVLRRFEIEILVDAVALKPGKPLVFGTAPEGKLVFGLPGNPVSSAVTFELFVRPALGRMQGCEKALRPELRATLAAPLVSRGPRRAYLPGWVAPSGPEGRLGARPIPTRGSADIVAFAKANALLILPEEIDRLEAGSEVAVFQLDNFFFKEDRWPPAPENRRS
jgi:molybdopterin molybdotransferase